MNGVTQQNASASEELSATAEEMNAQAETLKDLMAQFTLVGSDAPLTRVAKAEKPAKSKNKPSSRGDMKDFERF